MQQQAFAPIGIFDSGYGGLTVCRSIVQRMPQYDYIYLGDNARTPYGNRSFDTILNYTWQCVQWLYAQGCPLVVLACNTASAKALRTIQQKMLPTLNDTQFRVLGVIRPTAEVLAAHSRTKNIGILATKGTVASNSYPIELSNQDAAIKVHQQACPMWVPLIENNMAHTAAAAWFVQNDVSELMQQNQQIDTVLLACTHYPLIQETIQQFLPPSVKLVNQGDIVAESLHDYLQRHAAMQERISANGHRRFFTTDDVQDFDAQATRFYGSPVQATHVDLPH